MKIAIDTHAAEREGEGNCTYIRHLTLTLASLDNENQYILYAINPAHPFYKNFTRNFSENIAKKNTTCGYNHNHHTTHGHHPSPLYNSPQLSPPKITIKPLYFNSPLLRIPFSFPAAW